MSKYKNRASSRVPQLMLSLEYTITQKLNASCTGKSGKKLLKASPEIDRHVDLTLKRQAQHVGRILRNLIAKQGLDILALAWSSGVSEKTICKVKKGKKLPRLTTLIKAAEALNTRVILVFEPFYAFAPDRSTKFLWLLGEENLGAIIARFMLHLPTNASLTKTSGIACVKARSCCPSFKSIFRIACALGYRTSIRLHSNTM